MNAITFSMECTFTPSAGAFLALAGGVLSVRISQKFSYTVRGKCGACTGAADGVDSVRFSCEKLIDSAKRFSKMPKEGLQYMYIS